MVNHYKLDDYELLEQFKNVIEASVYLKWISEDDYELEYNAYKYKEYHDIRKELLERLSR